MRLARWMRANDFTITARIPRCIGPTAAAAQRGGSGTSAGVPSVLGSVIVPVSADAAATSDEQRYTSSPFTSLRPGTFRLKARRLRVPAAGTWQMPAQEPHVDSETRAPA